MGRLPVNEVSEWIDGLDIADMTGDNRPDLVVQLGPATSFTPRGLAVADINSDGRNDLLMANYNYGLVVVPQQAVAATATATVRVGRS